MGKLLLAFVVLIGGIVALIYVADPFQIYKETSFKSFYENIEKAIEKLDCAGIYYYKSDEFKNNYRFDYYVLKCEEEKTSLIEKIEVHNLWVIKDTGYVDRTRISCLNANCTGEGMLEKREVKKYLFKNGKWTITDDYEPLMLPSK